MGRFIHNNKKVNKRQLNVFYIKKSLLTFLSVIQNKNVNSLKVSCVM